jgi:hypothetical protein
LTDSLPTEDAEIGHRVSDSEGEEVSNWSDPVDNEHIAPKGLFHSTTVSWVLLILQCLMIVWHTKVGDGWQLQECSILWKMENHWIIVSMGGVREWILCTAIFSMAVSDFQGSNFWS